MIKRKISGIIFSTVILAISFWFIITTFEWAQIWQIILQARIEYILFTGLWIIIYWQLRALRWWLLLRASSNHVHYFNLYLCCATALAFATITPMQSGELIKIELLRKYGRIERFSGYSTFVVERILDLIAVLLIALLGVLSGFGIGLRKDIILIFAAVATLGIISLVFLLLKFKFRGRMGYFQKKMEDSIRNGWTLFSVLILTVLGWAAVATGWYTSMLSLNIDIGFLNTLFMSSIISIIGLISMIPGSVGISETGITIFLQNFGELLVRAQAGSIILRFYAFLVIFLGLVHFFLWNLLKRYKK